MSESQLFRFQCIDDRGLVSGALVHFRDGRKPGMAFTDPAMRIPARNPMKANGRGVVVAYLPNGSSYEVTVTYPTGAFIEQFQSSSVTGVTERIIEREVTKETVEVPADTVSQTAAAAMLDELEAVKTKLDDRPADPLEVSEEPPEAIADLFQSDRPYADQAQALWTKYNELTQKIMMNLATDAERAKHAKLQGELDWIKHHVFEAV